MKAHSTDPVVVVGGGFAGLTAALQLVCQGETVLLFEAADSVGGKACQVTVGDHRLDCGPTVLTMRWVFEQLFAQAQARLTDYVTLTALPVLARHFWGDGSQLDLFGEKARSRDAIGAAFGARQARGYEAFCAYSARLYAMVQEPFMQAPRPTPWDVVQRQGLAGLRNALNIDAWRSMHRALGDFFSDPRLLQLFGRYATYCGGSPFATCATFNVVAHVERLGVWAVHGGLSQLATALGRLAEARGAQIFTRTPVHRLLLNRGRVVGVRLHDGTEVRARAVVLNGGPETLPHVLPEHRAPRRQAALSAHTFALVGRLQGPELQHHNVFFGDDHAGEFDALFAQRRLPERPSVYVCAPDAGHPTLAVQRLLCLINAPASGEEVAPCLPSLHAQLKRFDLQWSLSAPMHCHTPTMFAQRYPGSAGALYGAPPHSWRSFFSRPGSRAPYRDLYWCGGSVHPGPGVPMATISGQLAAQALIADLRSTQRWHAAATPGGTSMPRAMTGNTP